MRRHRRKMPPPGMTLGGRPVDAVIWPGGGMAVEVTWYQSTCQGCGRDLLWELGQTTHRCGWCGMAAIWEGGAR